MERFLKLILKIDWIMMSAVFFLLFSGLATMNTIVVSNENFFTKQVLWIIISLIVFFIASFSDMRFLEKSSVLLFLYLTGLSLLVGLFFFGSTVNGATSWFNLGGFSFQPADLLKVILILFLAKYFSRRHIEIKNPKHIVVSFFYMLLPFSLVFFQPDFGSSIILFAIWLGMILVSGISKKHFLILTTIGLLICSVLWFFVLKTYQKDRIYAFLDPLADVQGAGYNAYQSMIAVGSGKILGKGLGFGTQSRLQFLPEHQTDFIFAAFAEEWGFVGSFLILICFFILIWRICVNSFSFSNNFQILFGLGLAFFIGTHFVINIGMNINVMPVTGITLPFMSYGGSHLITTFLGLGILMSFRRNQNLYSIKKDSDSDIDFMDKKYRVNDIPRF